MNEIVFVTHNKGKIATAEKYLKNTNVSIFEHELDEIRSDSVEEIAKHKVLEAYEVTHKPCMAMDSGFFIEGLNGFPRTFVNFALETVKIDGILKLMQGVENRNCKFLECLAYYDGKEIKYFYGESKGTLSDEICGADRDIKWSDLWYIFKPLGFDKTLAEMTDEERITRRNIDKSTSSLEGFAKWYNN